MPSKGGDPAAYLLKRQNQLLASKVLSLRLEKERAEQSYAVAIAHAERLRAIVDAIAVCARSVLVKVASPAEVGRSAGVPSAFDTALHNLESLAALKAGADGAPFEAAVRAAMHDWHKELFDGNMSALRKEQSIGKQVRRFLVSV